MKLPETFKKPVVAAIAGGIAGFLIGMLVFWVLAPVQVIDAPVSLLRADLQEDYLRMTIDSYARNQNAGLALQRWQNLGAAAPGLFLTIQQSATPENAQAIKAFGDLVNATVGIAAATPAAPETKPAGLSLTGYIIIGLSGAVLLGVLGFFLFYLLRRGRSGEANAAMKSAEISRTTEKTDFTALGLTQPVARTMTTYMLGDVLYDESLPIDSPNGEFLGEYGAGISETIGVGEPKKVAAIEVWLFDKSDKQTTTKVLLTPHMFQDKSVTDRLAAKGDLIMAQPGEEMYLETATLQMLARVMDVQFGAGPMPPNSFFERVTLELAVWPKPQV